MKRKTFYPNIWSTTPFAMNVLAHQDHEGRTIKELILKNTSIIELGVSEMELNIKKLAALDAEGKEYRVIDFPGQNSVKIKGIGSGHFLRSKSVVKLQPNTYTTLRFYIGNKNNQFIYNDGTVERVNKVDFLDFEIENGLIIKDNEATEVKIWFELAPFEFSRHFKHLLERFKKPKQAKPKLSNCIS